MKSPLVFSAIMLAASPSFASAQPQTASVTIAETGSTTAANCGRRGRNGPARCLQQLRESFGGFCALRERAIARYGEDFVQTAFPEGAATCASSRQ